MQISPCWLPPSNEAIGLLSDSVSTQLPGAKSDAALKTLLRFPARPIPSAGWCGDGAPFGGLLILDCAKGNNARIPVDGDPSIRPKEKLKLHFLLNPIMLAPPSLISQPHAFSNIEHP